MTKNILVDTDILIHFLRGRREAKDFLSSLLDRSQILCSSITVAEIFAGIRSGEEEKTRALVDNLLVLDVTREVAERAGHYRRTIRSQSLELDDCLIAATAFIHRSVLATGNGKHYPMRDIEVRVVACG
ncbi:MAG TPA: type II toxin-antitoxin system VapC family toxin [Thermodesulfobacteriota bacterium]|nr:type II toxin-antitoxin system VapC family toxin [Deltaproteobacteria bacterium]HQT98789.1 type II toxin-antitoxin system VapC family toxin [Thermodesulfobacteriota bacterium]